MHPRRVLFTALALVLAACSKPAGEESPPDAGAAPGAASAAAAPASAAASAKPATLKGSAAGAAAGQAAGGPSVAGEVVIKQHALPAPTKPLTDFKPGKSGFKFQNYGNEPGITNLTVTEVRRMFGDGVCASLTDDKCVLTPAAEQWIEASNASMGGGHCEGFAALALLMERGQIDPQLFGAATVAELEIAGNDKLQRELAYWFITQGVMPMAQAEDKSLTPVQVVEKLQASFQEGAAETYTLGVYAPGYKMGHATTPYAVVEKEDGVVWILHYDNNYPGEEKRVEVDTKANTWTYTTAADPAAGEHAYQGDAETKTLTIAPTSVRTGPMFCHFCGAVDGAAGGAPADGEAKGTKGSVGAANPGAAEMREIALEGNADLLITDEDGKRLGYVDDQLVQEIPGAFLAADKSADEDSEQDEPSYFLPTGKALKVTLSDAGAETESTVSLFGRGYTLAVEDIILSPEQEDEILFSADFTSLVYTTTSDETPILLLGIETSAADYEFEIQVSGEEAGQAAKLMLDLAKGTLSVQVKGGDEGDPTVALHLSRIDAEGGEQSYEHDGFTLGDGQTLSFAYLAWKGDKDALDVTLTGADGAVVWAKEEADEK